MNTTRHWRLLSTLLTGVALLGGAGLAPIAPAAAAPALATDCAPVGHVIPPTDKGRINGIASPARGDVWAVGGANVFSWTSGPHSAGGSDLLALHWTGSEWKSTPLPAFPGAYDKGELYEVVALAPNDVWASGLQYPQSQGYGWSSLMLHWDGNAWSWAKPAPGMTRSDYGTHLAGNSAQNLWALGDSLYLWNGTDWQNTAPDRIRQYWLQTLALGNGNEVWAAGSASRTERQPTPVIVHWDGAEWSTFSTTGVPTGQIITSITTVGADVWIGGSFGTARWTGSKWQIFHFPATENSGPYVTLAAHAPSDLWAIGGGTIYRWSGKSWESVAGPTDTHYNALGFEWSGDVWAGGAHVNGSGGPTSSDFSYDTRLVHIFSPCDVPTARVADPHQADATYFAPTGHTLRGAFRGYWEAHGGLAQFGYPITEPFQEKSATDGNTYLVQYFQRNRFEYHPENTPAYQVLLGLLGRTVTAGREGEAPFQPISGPPGGDEMNWYFPQTQHAIDSDFTYYWNTHGGLAVFGYPISEPFTEISPTDGKPYKVQYFERNRFEYHIEFAPEQRVLLGLLGANLLQARGWLP